MPSTGPNHDAHSRFDWNHVFVELHACLGAAFQKVVGFCQSAVIVQLGIFRDFRNVNRTREIGGIGEGAASRPTRTRGPWKVGKVDQFISGLLRL